MSCAHRRWRMPMAGVTSIVENNMPARIALNARQTDTKILSGDPPGALASRVTMVLPVVGPCTQTAKYLFMRSTTLLR